MANIAEYIPSRSSGKPITFSYSGPSAPPCSRDDTKVRGFRLIFIWLAAILFSWILAGSVIYGLFLTVSSLLS
ncbi:hypothetical protein GGE65_001669 [Skermanella aerolata]|uniref:hypothetical protein n=1 Tax=Skermanella aerolata TaxID=393310 RepID=UPI0005CB4265|nr:hypothetical protein N826_28420 [Skermanella aerolata KACC 11604]